VRGTLNLLKKHIFTLRANAFQLGFNKNANMFSLPPAVLLLNGFPGVGKFTIAKAISAKLTQGNFPHRLLDNHQLIDPAASIQPVRNAEHYELRQSFRAVAFEGLKLVKEENLVIIMTACLSTSPVPTPYNDIEQFIQYVDLADARGVPLVVVNLVCDFSTNSERLRSTDRMGVNGKMKLVDPEILEKIRRETTILDQDQAMACKKSGELFHFTLDVSKLTTEEVTQEVSEVFKKVVSKLN
jgi:chloramphenicol 3-O-phosphotransferase